MGNLFKKTDNSQWNQQNTITKSSGLKIAVSFGFTILLLSFLIPYITHHIEEFIQLYLICKKNFIFIFWSAILFILLIAISGLQFNYLTQLFNLNLPIKEWFGLAVINNFYNLITPFRGGLVTKAVYLKQKYKFSYTSFVSVQGAFQVFSLLTAGITGFIGIWFISDTYYRSNILILSFLGSIVILILILLTSIPRFRIETEREQTNRLRSRLIKIVNGWHLLKQDKKRLWIITALTLSQRILKAYFLILIYYCLDINLGFWGALFISSITMFSKVISILPGNLGLDDAVTVLSASLIGIPLESAIGATILARMINLSLGLTLGPLFSYLLLKK